jgi:predicted outer membrane repeat protein
METADFQDLTSLAISGEGHAVIACTEAGLAFINVTDLTFSDVSFLRCASIRNSTSKNYTTGVSISEFQVGLYFYWCENISMSNVIVSNSPNATGVVIYDTNGTNTFSNSNFTSNAVTDGSHYPGGGGVYVEHTYCKPGILSCDIPTSERNKGANYTFLSCDFSYNRATNLDPRDNFTYVFPYKEDHQSFGRGGGLSFYIRGDASDIKLIVNDSHFYNNVAKWGGGLNVDLQDNANGNNILIKNSTFHNNVCPFTILNGTAGGGMRLTHYVYGYNNSIPKTAMLDNFEVDHCEFVNNSALNGAGMSVYWAMQDVLSNQVSVFLINNSIFEKNVAKLGSAIYAEQFWSVSRGLPATICIESCRFNNNTYRYWYGVDTGRISDPLQLGFGTVCLTSSNAWFKKKVSFTNNTGSALALAGGSVNFDGVYALFENNSAHEGAGIMLSGESIIEVGNGTSLVFRGNSASYRGGAIHAHYITRKNLATDLNCLMRYTNPLVHPNDWNVRVQFIDNWDSRHSRANAIYATSLLPCSMVGGSGVYVATTNSTVFCWPGWSYHHEGKRVNCSSQIATDIGFMKYTGNKTEGTEINNTIHAYPGWEFELPVQVRNDLGQIIGNETVFTGNIDSEYVNQSIIYGKKAVVYGNENEAYNMIVTTHNLRIWFVKVHVDLQPCPPGFATKSGSCSCAGTFGGNLFCDFQERKARLNSGLWMLFDNGSYYVAQCPPSYCVNIDKLPLDHNELNSKLCAPNRGGGVCGECLGDYGPAINSHTYECTNCADINLAANVMKYIASVYLPLIVLFTILILFDIRLTTGPANAFIIYCQFLSSTFSLDVDGGLSLDQVMKDYSKGYSYAYRFPYGIFNLEFVENFLPPICLSANFNTLSVLGLDYCVAFSPLIMIAVVVAIFKLKERCSLLTRKSLFFSKKTRGIDEALLPAFASYLLLSYTKFSTVSAHILATHTLVDENNSFYYPPDGERVYVAGQLTTHSKEYYPYYITAILVCCTFVAIPPLLFLDYPLRVAEWLLLKVRFLQRIYPGDKVHILMDTFQGCYRKNMRFFAGVYFFFRLFIFVISFRFFRGWSLHFMVQQIACSLMVVLIAVCQPYKRTFLNAVDALIFTNLSIINCISFYIHEKLKNHDDDYTPVRSVFLIQYILVFLPLVYMLAYIVWRKTMPYHERIMENIRKCCNVFPRNKRLTNVAESASLLGTNSNTQSIKSYSPYRAKDDMEVTFIARSRDRNTYQPRVPVTLVGLHNDTSMGDASIYQFASSKTNGTSKTTNRTN